VPDPIGLLAASAVAERVLWWLVAAIAAACLVRAWRAPANGRTHLVVGRRAERAAVLVVLAWALLTRLGGYASPFQPRNYYAQVSVVYTADALGTGDLGRRWLDQLRNVQVLFEHQSPILAPVTAAMQHILGPSIELPTIVGALWGTLAVLLAWAVGRSVESPAFGVLFAAFVAISPLQITWSRIGGIHIGASPAVLLSICAGWLAGLRGGIGAGLLLGLVAWSCTYFYFAARVGMGLAFVALYAGWRRSGRGAGRLIALTAAATVGLAVCFLLHRAANPTQSLWPAVQGYVGSRGEAGASDWVKSAAANIAEQTRRAFDAYFWRDRLGPIAARTSATPSPWIGTLLAPGMSGGGLLFVPVLVFGAIGLVSCLRHPIDRGLWVALAIAGWLPAVLSVPTARRFLVFDLGWCALAAFGLLSLLESSLLRPSTGAGRWRWGCAVLAAIALWSAAALGLSWMSAPSQQAFIPFGDSGFGDGSTCLGCIRTGRVWQEEIQAGRMVVMFDTDVYRENPTMPGGVPLYGKTAALAAGHPGRFLDFYAVASNYDPEPPRPGPIAPVPPADVIGAVGARIEAEHPDAIVWWFTQPNAWEQRLIDALVQAGSSRSLPPAVPMWGSDRGSVEVSPIRIETPWERRQEALNALRPIIDPAPPPPCMRLERVSARQVHSWPLAIAPNPPSGDGVPSWAVAIPGEAEIWGARRPSGDPVWFEYRQRSDGSAEVDLAEFGGTSRTWQPGGEERPGIPLPGPRPIGRDCVARLDDGWWVVDPVAGTLWPPGPRSAPYPIGTIGLTRFGDLLALATADQRLLVVDPVAKRLVVAFPAQVTPSRRQHFGECAMLTAGDDWIASLDQLRGLLSFYGADGMPLGRVSLTQLVGTVPRSVHTIRAAGKYLGVGHDTTVTTLRVVRDPRCATARTSGSG
jgi:hypothetical protein